MTKIYSYVLRFDDGGAPNPYLDICTLAICKPVIRRNAEIGDWVVGTGSSRSSCNNGITRDFSNHLVYAMKITDIKSMEEYDQYCTTSLKGKIPKWNSKIWPEKMGDSIYDYSQKTGKPLLRESVHKEGNVDHDLSGKRVLLSTDFYYFGENAIAIPDHLVQIVKRNQGHRKILNPDLIRHFEEWIRIGYNKNFLYGNPQLMHRFNREMTDREISECAKVSCAYDTSEEEIIGCN